jgi:hypothetical protein
MRAMPKMKSIVDMRATDRLNSITGVRGEPYKQSKPSP